jgi:hypothetical protein
MSGRKTRAVIFSSSTNSFEKDGMVDEDETDSEVRFDGLLEDDGMIDEDEAAENGVVDKNTEVR